MSLSLNLQLSRSNWTLDCQAQFEPGVNIILGPSGSGKSSLLRAIAGLQRWPNGRIQFDGQDLNALATHKRQLGYLPQDTQLIGHLSIAAHLQMARRWSKQAFNEGLTQQLIQELDLKALLDTPAKQLSGGQRKRASLACALIGGAKLLLLDEPGSGLDHDSHERFLDYLARLTRQHQLTTILVTHQLWEAARCGNYASAIQESQLLSPRPLNELLCSEPLATRRDAVAAWDLSIDSYSADDRLLRLRKGQQSIEVPGEQPRETGDKRILIPASSVSLSRENNPSDSVRNHVEVTIEAIYPCRAGEVVLRLKSGAGLLLARITQRSCSDLQLNVGRAAVAQIKATALH